MCSPVQRQKELRCGCGEIDREAVIYAHVIISRSLVPGHAVIYGNEVADLLVKRGAGGITSSSLRMPDLVGLPTLNNLRLQFKLPPLV